MSLDPLARAFLLAVDRLTHEAYGPTDGKAVRAELHRLGHDASDKALDNLLTSLQRAGYIRAYLSFGGIEGADMLHLTEYGWRAVRSIDPFERTQLETRRLLASDWFRDAYPRAFEPWADAERLLGADDAETQLTTVGHKVREAMQAFATAMVKEHRPQDVDADPAHARARLGAVIAAARPRLGDARRQALEALGDLWEAADALTQRQEHGAQKEGQTITRTDARRLVWLTMFLMVEFVMTFEDLPVEPPAHLEGG